MREFRKKQKRLFNIMRAVVIFGAVYIFVFIGVEPYIAQISSVADMILRTFADLTVVAVLVLIFMYYTQYSKSDSFLNYIEHEISDAGYYLTARNENTSKDYCDAVFDDLKSCGFSVDKKLEISELDFDFRAYKVKEFIYCAVIEDLDRNDVLAYLDTVFDDITVHNLKRRGNAVMLFISDNPQESAIALSKAVTTFGKKDQIKLVCAIVNPDNRHIYFLGNLPSKCQQLIVNHIMNCELPIKDKYICSEKLNFQFELEEKMKEFNITDFKNGNFFAH